jgi:hypothetical protein
MSNLKARDIHHRYAILSAELLPIVFSKEGASWKIEGGKGREGEGRGGEGRGNQTFAAYSRTWGSIH